MEALFEIIIVTSSALVVWLADKAYKKTQKFFYDLKVLQDEVRRLKEMHHIK